MPAIRPHLRYFAVLCFLGITLWLRFLKTLILPFFRPFFENTAIKKRLPQKLQQPPARPWPSPANYAASKSVWFSLALFPVCHLLTWRQSKVHNRKDTSTGAPDTGELIGATQPACIIMMPYKNMIARNINFCNKKNPPFGVGEMRRRKNAGAYLSGAPRSCFSVQDLHTLCRFGFENLFFRVLITSRGFSDRHKFYWDF